MFIINRAEQEVDGKLLFLDTLLHRKNDGSLDKSIYRKPTHTDRYLNFSSHHPHHVKESVLSCLFHRARTIAQGEHTQVEEDHPRGVLEGNRYPKAFVKMASKPHSERASRGTLSNSVHPLCSRPKQRCETGMQKIQHPNSLLIGTRPRLAGKEVGSCVPDPLQLQPCIYRGDEESPRDPHKGAQSCHQTGRDREVSHSRARLGTTIPNTVGEDQRVGPSNEHHIAHQRGSTHPPHQSRTDQQRQGCRHSGMLATGPGPCCDGELHLRHATPRN